MTSQDNESKCTSMWRDERVGTNGTEWEHLKILMEEERKNKTIKPVEVYKCSKGGKKGYESAWTDDDFIKYFDINDKERVNILNTLNEAFHQSSTKYVNK